MTLTYFNGSATPPTALTGTATSSVLVSIGPISGTQLATGATGRTVTWTCAGDGNYAPLTGSVLAAS